MFCVVNLSFYFRVLATVLRTSILVVAVGSGGGGSTSGIGQALLWIEPEFIGSFEGDFAGSEEDILGFFVSCGKHMVCLAFPQDLINQPLDIVVHDVVVNVRKSFCRVICEVPPIWLNEDRCLVFIALFSEEKTADYLQALQTSFLGALAFVVYADEATTRVPATRTDEGRFVIYTNALTVHTYNIQCVDVVVGLVVDTVYQWLKIPVVLFVGHKDLD